MSRPYGISGLSRGLIGDKLAALGFEVETLSTSTMGTHYDRNVADGGSAPGPRADGHVRDERSGRSRSPCPMVERENRATRSVRGPQAATSGNKLCERRAEHERVAVMLTRPIRHFASAYASARSMRLFTGTFRTFVITRWSSAGLRRSSRRALRLIDVPLQFRATCSLARPRIIAKALAHPERTHPFNMQVASAATRALDRVRNDSRPPDGCTLSRTARDQSQPPLKSL